MKAPYENVLQLASDCFPVFLGGSSRSFCENFQNILIGSFISPKSLAIYIFTQKIFQVCVMILAPLGSSIYSSFSHVKISRHSETKPNVFEMTLAVYYTLSAILLAVAVAANELLVSLWVGPGNFGGMLLTVIIAFAALFTVRHAFSSYLIYSTGKFSRVALLDILYSGARLILMVALIRSFGVVAIPLADFFSGFAILNILGGRLILKSLPISNSIINPFIQGVLVFLVLVALGVAFPFQMEKNPGYSELVVAILLFLSVCMSCSFLSLRRFLPAGK